MKGIGLSLCLVRVLSWQPGSLAALAAEIYLAGSCLGPVADLLVKLYFLQQPLLSRHSSDALCAVCSSPALSASTLDTVLGRVLLAEGAWNVRDADALLSTTHVLEVGMARCAG